MKCLHLYLVAVGLLLGGCRDRHLVCKDGDGNVIVDTTDLSTDPRQYETAWSWRTTSDDTYHEISVPPHSCAYESHPAGKKQEPEMPQYAETSEQQVNAEEPTP